MLTSETPVRVKSRTEQQRQALCEALNEVLRTLDDLQCFVGLGMNTFYLPGTNVSLGVTRQDIHGYARLLGAVRRQVRGCGFEQSWKLLEARDAKTGRTLVGELYRLMLAWPRYAPGTVAGKTKVWQEADLRERLRSSLFTLNRVYMQQLGHDKGLSGLC